VGATSILNEFKAFSKKHYLKDVTLKILKEYSWWSREQSPSKSIRTGAVQQDSDSMMFSEFSEMPRSANEQPALLPKLLRQIDFSPQKLKMVM
jgi:hypothetical protein